MSAFVKIGHFIWPFLCSHLYHMAPRKLTNVSEFFLLVLSEEPELQPLIFGLFLSMYLITVFGNLFLILAISSDSHLHTPMYFFLSILSFVDVCFISTTIPKMLQSIHTQRKDIAYEECITQMYFFTLFAGLDDFLLTVMSYDHFAAICHPCTKGHHELKALWTTGPSFLDHECSAFLVANLHGVATVLLQRLGNPSLFL